MMKKYRFKHLPFAGLLLAALVSIGGCGNPSGPPGTPNTDALSATITAAELALAKTKPAAAQNEVSPAYIWVTQPVYDNFAAAIEAAKSVKNSTADQTAVDAANIALEAALAAFEEFQDKGTKIDGFSKDELEAFLSDAAARKAETNINVDDKPLDELSPLKYYISQEDMDTLEAAMSAAVAAAETTPGGEKPYDTVYNALVAAMAHVVQGTPTTESKAALKNAMTATQTATQDIQTAADASYAPVGSTWATPAQWEPFTTATNNAQTVYDNADAAKKAVDEAKAAFDTAYTAFMAAAAANPPGTGTNFTAALTITGMTDYKGEQFGVSIVAEDKTNLSPDDVIAKSMTYVTVDTNGTLKVDTFLNLDDNPWEGDGSYFIVIQREEFGHWISKAKHNFLDTPKAVLSWSDMRSLGFEASFLDLAHMVDPEMPSFPVTALDGFFAEMAEIANENLEEGESPETFTTYAEWKSMMRAEWEIGPEDIDIFKLYKDKYLTQEYKGSDNVGPTTKFYCIVPWWTGESVGPGLELGEQVGLIEGDITFTNVPDGGIGVWVNANGVSWSSQWSPTLEISHDTIEHWELPIFEDYNFTPGSTSFRFSIYPIAIATQNGGMSFGGYSKDVSSVNANVGNLGTIDCSYIVLSGTISADYHGVPDKVYVYARNSEVNTGSMYIEGGAQIEPAHDGGNWKLALPKATLPNASNNIQITVSLEKDGYPTYNGGVIKTITVTGNSSGETGIALGTVNGN